MRTVDQDELEQEEMERGREARILAVKAVSQMLEGTGPRFESSILRMAWDIEKYILGETHL